MRFFEGTLMPIRPVCHPRESGEKSPAPDAWIDDVVRQLPRSVLLARRPVPAVATVLPDEAEDAIQTFLHTCTRFLLSGGGVLRLAGDGLSERMLYWVLATGLSRLRGMDVRAVVCGEVFRSEVAPERPAESDVAVLLEAPVYPAVSEWEAGPGLNVLVGHALDWKALGIRPDWTMRVEEQAAVVRRLESEVATIERLARSEGEARRALLLNACSMDAPVNGALSGFVTVGEGGWVSVESGQWLAREVVGEVEAIEVPDVLAARWRRVQELRRRTV